MTATKQQGTDWKLYSKEAYEAAEKWAHPQLLEIWAIIQLPGCDEHGRPVLKEADIAKIAQAVAILNVDFNHPDVKALRQHVSKRGKKQ